jgi:nucleoid DNA-binding protein
MARKIKLYAWATPVAISRSPVDHTWVTTYDNRSAALRGVKEVVAAAQSYWYCYGFFYPKGGTPANPKGFLGEQVGDLRLAHCVAQPNSDSWKVPAARGTIFIYMRDGMCHQLANQVLYSTGIGGTRPLTVTTARGYGASAYIYGTYGLRTEEWKEKIKSCGSPTAPRRTTPNPPKAKGQESLRGTEMSNLPDDFETRAREVLEEKNPKLLDDLLALCAETRRYAAKRWSTSALPSAPVINADNQRLIDRAARLLGPETFEEIFGFPSNQKIDLVDPAIQHLNDAERSALGERYVRGMKPAKKPGTPATVTLKNLAAHLSASHEMSKKQTEAVLGDLVGLVTKHLKKGDRIRIGGLGILQVRKRAARMGRNPATGEPIQIKASKKVAFRPAKEIKEAV